ncbi:MAG: alpha/beta hydrolase family protein, partial [Asticcacaulis sp.]
MSLIQRVYVLKAKFLTALLGGLLLCGLFASPLVAQDASLQPLTIAYYVKDPQIAHLTISPDGSRLAYVLSTNNKRILSIAETTGKSISTFNMEKIKIRHLEWVDNKHLIITRSETATLNMYEKARDEYYQNLVIDLESSNFKSLLKGLDGVNEVSEDDLMFRSVDGNSIVYTGHHGFDGFSNFSYHLYEINLNNKKKKMLMSGNSMTVDWIVDGQGKPSGVIDYIPENGNWEIARIFNKQRLKMVLGGRSYFSSPRFIGLDSQYGDPLVYIANAETEVYNIYRLKSDGEVSEPLFENYEDIDHLIIDPHTQVLAGYALPFGRDRYTFFDANLAAIWRGTQKALKDHRLTYYTASRDFKAMLITVEGPEDPGSFYHLNTETKELTFLADMRPQIKPEHLGAQSLIRYKAADGLEIEAVLTTPPPVVLSGRAVKNFPLIVMPHGGPQSYDGYGFDGWAQALASRGYVVLQPNFRGSDGYGADFIAAGYGEWGAKMQTDLSDGVRHLAQSRMIDPKRVCIVGASYGGYAALAGVTLDPGIYRCASAIAGVSDLRVMMNKEKEDFGRRHPVTRYWSQFMGDQKTWNERSPARLADKVTVPVQLIHGKDDTVVPLRQS